MRFYETISVDVKTGTVSYANVPGFDLDMERVYRTASIYAETGACSDVKTAVKIAINNQYAAWAGLQRTFNGMGMS